MAIISTTATLIGKSALCAYYAVQPSVTYAWSVGSVLYVCYKARNEGVLEAVCIKKVKWDGYVLLYTDTLNGLWNENDLCEEGDALLSVKTYIEEQEQLLIQKSLLCN